MKILQLHGYTQDMAGYIDEMEWIKNVNRSNDCLRYAWSELNKTYGYKIQVCSFTKFGEVRSLTRDDIEYTFFPVMFPHLYYHRIGSYSRSCFRYILSNKWDYIVFNYIGGIFNWWLAEYLRRKRIPCGIYYQWMEKKRKLDFTADLMRKRIIEGATFHVASTNLQKKYLAKSFKIKEASIYVIPKGIRTDVFTPSPEEKTEKEFPKLLTVARIERGKGVLEAVKCLGFVRRHFSSATLEIVGRKHDIKYVREIEKYIKENSLSGVVIFTDYIDNFRLPEKYNSADLMIFPSKSEGLAKVVLESMACGLPVVALKNSGGPDEIIDHDSDGWLASSESFNETVVNVLRDRELLRRFGEKGRDKILRNYTFEKHYQDERSLFESLNKDKE